MSKEKTSGIRPKLEVLIILVFFLSFIIWAVSKCNASSALAALQNQEEGIDSESIDTSTTATTAADNPGTPGAIITPTPGTPSAPSSNTTRRLSSPNLANDYSKLYVTIEGLNMRTGPHLDSTILHKLSLFEEVWFLNEVTDSTQQISLGTEIADEPWVKIKHKTGRIGWVYGAGVNYYRKKRLE